MMVVVLCADFVPLIQLIAAMPLAITAVLADMLIAGALCYHLHNKRTVFKSYVDDSPSSRMAQY